MIAYEACMRLCLHSQSVDRVHEASYFLNNECKTMRKAFSLEKFFLQSEEELLGKGPCELVTEPSAPKNKKTIGKIRVQGIYTLLTLHLTFCIVCSVCAYITVLILYSS